MYFNQLVTHFASFTLLKMTRLNYFTDVNTLGPCGYVDWIVLAQDRDRWRTLLTAVMNLRVP